MLGASSGQQLPMKMSVTALISRDEAAHGILKFCAPDLARTRPASWRQAPQHAHSAILDHFPALPVVCFHICIHIYIPRVIECMHVALHESTVFVCFASRGRVICHCQLLYRCQELECAYRMWRTHLCPSTREEVLCMEGLLYALCGTYCAAWQI